MLCACELPHVRQADHLCNLLTDHGDSEQDAVVKGARFVQSEVETRQISKWAAPVPLSMGPTCGTWMETRPRRCILCGAL